MISLIVLSTESLFTGTSPYLWINWFKMWQLYGSIGKISYRQINTSFCTPYSGLMKGASFSAKFMVSSIATCAASSWYFLNIVANALITTAPLLISSYSMLSISSYCDSLGRKLWSGLTQRGPNTSSNISIFSQSYIVISLKPLGSSATLVSATLRLPLIPGYWLDSNRFIIAWRISGVSFSSNKLMI